VLESKFNQFGFVIPSVMSISQTTDWSTSPSTAKLHALFSIDDVSYAPVSNVSPPATLTP
jgi:hypothetical protein